MSVYHDEVEIEDFEYDEDEEVYYYPCPCGDQFQISKEELAAGVEEATCPSCSLVIKVIYDKEAFAAKQEELVRDEEKQILIQKVWVTLDDFLRYWYSAFFIHTFKLNKVGHTNNGQSIYIYN